MPGAEQLPFFGTRLPIPPPIRAGLPREVRNVSGAISLPRTITTKVWIFGCNFKEEGDHGVGQAMGSSIRMVVPLFTSESISIFPR